jgi:hypothetical protein
MIAREAVPVAARSRETARPDERFADRRTSTTRRGTRTADGNDGSLQMAYVAGGPAVGRLAGRWTGLHGEPGSPGWPRERVESQASSAPETKPAAKDVP